MYNLDQIREKLQDRRIAKVAQATGLHRFTIYKIRDGETKDPNFSSLMKLNEYFKAQETNNA